MNLNRRQVPQASATTAGLMATGAALVAPPTLARPAQALRPPLALAEEAFLGRSLDSTCPNCGRRIDVCSTNVFRFTHRWDTRRT